MAAIGSEAIFNIVITNRSRTNLNNLLVKDHFDPGLEFLDPKDKKAIKSQSNTRWAICLPANGANLILPSTLLKRAIFAIRSR